MSSTKDKKNKLLKRNSASGSVMKLKAKKKKGTNIFGSKGVSHSIKKPSKLISHPKLKVSIFCGCLQYLTPELNFKASVIANSINLDRCRKAPVPKRKRLVRYFENHLRKSGK